MKQYIEKVVDGEDLEIDQARDAMSLIFKDATDAQIGAFLVGLKMKGEAVDEIAGFVKGMKELARMIAPKSSPLIDTCGTGGDGYSTINISTASAIVTASVGLPVAKHGNYAMTSKCGSADVLSELGVKIDLQPEEVEALIEKIGIGFMLAPVFHPSMKRVVSPRKEVGVRTVFNILGPLTNPANAEAQVIGVFDESLCEKLVGVLKELGTRRALVVHGSGMDEISNADMTLVSELKDGKISSYSVEPEDFGYKRRSVEEIAGGTIEDNASDIVGVLDGELKGAKREIICINSGASIYVGGLARSIKEGAEMAENAIDNGDALAKLREFVEESGGSSRIERYQQ
ncbi:MAG: anthranilate phosphoribosyltransferase [Halobacteriota archaeon]|nr:anthranilate phosphoribosyltransferase [Halobacteriota archaeon]